MDITPVEPVLDHRRVLNHAFPAGDAPNDWTAEQMEVWFQAAIDDGVWSDWEQWRDAVAQSGGFRTILRDMNFPSPIIATLTLIDTLSRIVPPPTDDLTQVWLDMLAGLVNNGLVLPAVQVTEFNTLTLALALPKRMLIPEPV